MKLLAFIKTTFMATVKNLYSLVLVFSLFPIFLGLLTGYMNEDMFVPSVDMPVMAVKVIDEDNSVESRNLVNFLESQEMRHIVEIKEEGEYIITIPEGYGESFLNGKGAAIEVNVTEEGSTRQGNTLAQIVDKYNEERYLNLMIEKSIEDRIGTEEEKEELYQSIYGKIAKIYNDRLIENRIITIRKSLTSYEHFSITFLSYMLFLVITHLINGDYLARENELYSRIMASPLTEIQYFNYNLVSSYIFVVIFNLLYVLAYRILGLSFTGALSLLIAIVLVQSLLGTVLAAFVSLFLNKVVSNVILDILIILQLLAGVTYVPISKIGDGLLADIIDKYLPNALIVRTYRNYLLYDNFTSIYMGILSMLIVSVIIYMICIIRVKRKRGEAW